MEKEHIARHPRIESDQRDLTQTLSSMLNCRRYLESLGFQEILDTSYDPRDINSIGGGYGKIVFPDGSEVDDEDFINSNNRDSLIERMISKRAMFVPIRYGYENRERSRVVRTTFGGNAYRFFLSIIDTTKEKAGFPLKLFKSKPEQFANRFYMRLRKQIITDTDLEEFAKYQQGLDDAMRQGTLLTYTPQIPQRKPAQAQEVEMPQVETHFINPWEVEIPKLGKNE
ncbi:MAG: hypothetical protein ACTSWZ_01950 [Candidatus Heimdallarchaeaceae archaeon]